MEAHTKPLFNKNTLTIGSDALPFSSKEMMDDSITTKEYVNKAKKSLRAFKLELTNHDNPKFIQDTTVEVGLVLEAMLNHAPCDEGKRYAACAIITCHRDGTKGIIAELHALAHDWLKFLLAPFRIAYRCRKPEDPGLCEADILSYESGLVIKDTPPEFLEPLKLRQNGECAVIKIGSEPDGMIFTAGAHIIKHSLVNGSQSNTGNHPSLQITWAILCHYAHLDQETLREIGRLVDLPGNGMLLEISMRITFDRFLWYLEPREQQNEYHIRWVDKQPLIFHWYGQHVVRFTDDSGLNIPLPDPKFIQIHASIVKIIWDIRADKYFDTLVAIPDGRSYADSIEFEKLLAGLDNHSAN